MILKLDPRYPVVWRSPSSVQVGIDPPIVVVEDLTSGQERLAEDVTVTVRSDGPRKPGTEE